MTIHKSYNATDKVWVVIQNWAGQANLTQITEYKTEREADVFINQCLEIERSVKRIGAV